MTLVRELVHRLRVAFGDGDVENVPALNQILSRAPGTDTIPEDRVAWIGTLLEWCLRRNGDTDVARTTTRFRYFLQSLERSAATRDATWEALYRILRRHDLAAFFAETGYSPEHGLWSDFTRRLLSRVFPNERLSVDPRRALLEAVANENDAAELSVVPDALFEDFERFVVDRGQSADLRTRLREEIREALVLLSATIAHYGLSAELRDRLPVGLDSRPVRTASFVKLAASLQALAFAGEAEAAIAPVNEDFSSLIVHCRSDIAHVYATLNATGVSVDLVYRLELLGASLGRSDRLLSFLSPAPADDPERRGAVRDFLVASAASALRAQSVRTHFKQHFYLMSRSVAERNGISGEHYVARSPDERKKLFLSALAGGAFVVLMTIAKTYFLRWDLPPLFRAVGVWIIYSGGFLAMQAFHLTLATKVPSFAANHLAKTLRLAREETSDDGALGRRLAVRAEWAAILKSQAVCIAGNIVAAAAFATALGFIFRGLGDGSLMTAEYAEHTIHGLHPIFSPVLFQGAIVGILLWISSLAGGWFENWVVYRDLPTAISRDRRIRALVGDARAAGLGAGLREQASGIATNVTLGFLFAFGPVLGGIVGLDLDGKHVTFMTASAILSATNIGHALPLGEWIPAVCGLLGVGVLNFGVSFLIALDIAARSQKLRRRWVFLTLGFGARASAPR